MTFDPRDATFRKITPTIANSLGRHGCALLKGFFNPYELGEFDKRITRNIAALEPDAVDLSAAGGYKTVGFPTYIAGYDSAEKIRAAFRRSYPGLFDTAKMNDMDCETLPRYVFRRMRDTGLDRILERYLGVERLSTAPNICHVRSFDVPAPGTIEVAEHGAEFHQDNRLYRTEREILTLWFPFRYQHGKMASLEFLPRGEKTIIPCKTDDSCGIERHLFPRSMFWSPAYELGDAVVISGYSPHRTYYPSEVCLERTSVDIRFFPNEQPHAIYALPTWRRFF